MACRLALAASFSEAISIVNSDAKAVQLLLRLRTDQCLFFWSVTGTANCKIQRVRSANQIMQSIRAVTINTIPYGLETSYVASHSSSCQYIHTCILERARSHEASEKKRCAMSSVNLAGGLRHKRPIFFVHVIIHRTHIAIASSLLQPPYQGIDHTLLD